MIMRSFKLQMFASPGIRKDKQNDQELGEDATGFVYTDDYAVLWIADGAPGASIEFEESHFNSRILAQCMGECFEKVVLKDEILRRPLDDIFFREFTDELYKKLSELLNGVDECLRLNKDSINFDELLPIKMKGKEKTYSFTWSTTFVGVIIDIKNRIGYTISMGDCIALVNSTTPKKLIDRLISPSTKLKIITEKTNRLFIEWYIKENLDLSKIEITKICPHIETTKNIESIILMCDGVITYNDIEDKFADKDVETIWRELKPMNNKTDDDKTAVFFKIME